jgi:predicted O-methyltransferase YrrM
MGLEDVLLQVMLFDMSKLTKGVAWFCDIANVLFVDRFNPARRAISEQASTACRALAFHARARIRQLDLRELVPMLSDQCIEEVLLPGPATDLGNVGSQVGYHVLGSVVRAIQPKLIFETGTYLGVSALALALNAPADCRVVTLDLPDDAPAEAVPGLNAIDQLHVRTSRNRVGEAFLRSPFCDRIVQLREDSMTFRAEKHLQSVDLVYIDGGHSTPVITKDTENAFRVLGPQGTIVWDDYFHLYPDVVTFLDGLADRYPLHGIKGTNFVIYSRRWDRSASAPD